MIHSHSPVAFTTSPSDSRDHWIFQPFRRLWRKVERWIRGRREAARLRRLNQRHNGQDVTLVPVSPSFKDGVKGNNAVNNNAADDNEDDAGYTLELDPRIYHEQYGGGRRTWAQIKQWNAHVAECVRELGCALATTILPPLATVNEPPLPPTRAAHRRRDSLTGPSMVAEQQQPQQPPPPPPQQQQLQPQQQEKADEDRLSSMVPRLDLAGVHGSGDDAPDTTALVSSSSSSPFSPSPSPLSPSPLPSPYSAYVSATSGLSTATAASTSTNTFGSLDFTGALGQPLTVLYFLHWNPTAASTAQTDDRVLIFSGERDARLTPHYLRWIGWIVGGSSRGGNVRGGGANGGTSGGANGEDVAVDESVPSFLAWERPTGTDDPRDVELALEALAEFVLSLSAPFEHVSDGEDYDGEVGTTMTPSSSAPPRQTSSRTLLTFYSFDDGSVATLRVATKMEDHVYFVAVLSGRVEWTVEPAAAFDGLVVFVHGSDDRVSTLADVQVYAQHRYPDSSFVVEVPGAGHHLHRSDPEMARVTALEIRMLLSKPEKYFEVMTPR